MTDSSLKITARKLHSAFFGNKQQKQGLEEIIRLTLGSHLLQARGVLREVLNTGILSEAVEYDVKRLIFVTEELQAIAGALMEGRKIRWSYVDDDEEV